METILVTGGAGFIGSNIAEALLARGHGVVVLDDLSTGRMKNIEHHLANPAFAFYRGSILDSGLLKDIMQKHTVSRISHQAAVASVTKSIEDPVATSQVNIIGTINLFNIARSYGCKRIVFASSCAIYGDTKELPIRESITLNSKSPYAASKASNELHAGVFYGLYGTKIIGLRYFNVYGKRQDPASEYAAVVPRFITYALENKAIPIEGDGMQTRDFIYIDDVVQANLKALLKEEINGDMVYNVAYGRQTSIVGLAEKIVEISGSKSKIVHLPPRQGDVRNSHADIENAKKHLDYVPAHSIDSGLKNTINWYREQMNKTDGRTHEALSSQLRPVRI